MLKPRRLLCTYQKNIDCRIIAGYPSFISAGSDPELIEEDVFRLVLPMSGQSQAGTPTETSGKTSGKTSKKILAALIKDPELTIPKLADQIGRSARAIEHALRKLREDGKWKVLWILKKWIS